MANVFEPVRSHYLDCYRQSVEKARRELEQPVTELLLEPGGITEAEPLFKLYRVDILGMQDSRHVIREVTVSPTTLPAGLLGYACPVSLAPCAWYGIEVAVTAPHLPEAPLLVWTESWLDPDDKHPEDELGFQHVIHSILRPRTFPVGYHLAVDFGSAPTTALHELLQVVASSGATHIHVGSFSLNRFGAGA